MDISIVIPVFNQLYFTKISLESLQKTIPDDVKIIVIDNGSTDGTGEYLATLHGVRVMRNSDNLGCACAWNQGVNTTQSEWVVISNNDVIVSPGWLEGLLSFAEEVGADVVSPAIREGEYNYDIVQYSKDFIERMACVSRIGVAQGVCFMVRRYVFERIGLFDENFKIGQFEDADFFRRAKIAGFTLITTGRSFIHHFSSITQDSIRKDESMKPYESENRMYFRRKWKLTWWKRFLQRRYVKLRDSWWRLSERSLYGHTLIEKWIDGRLRYF